MSKKIIITVGILIVIFVLFFVIKNISFAPTTPTQESESQPESVGKENNQIEPQFPGQTLPFSNAPKDIAWTVFQKYLGYNKNRDFEGVKNVVYKIASVCEDPKTRIDCEARMNLAYQYGSILKKEDFVNVWSDEKQIILATDFWLESSKDLDQYGRFRSIIFFVKGANDEWKLLSFSPTKGGATNKGAASQEEVDARLIRYTEDNDKDGKPDYEEECLQTQDKENCTQTSPKLRDTDGDGLWDGIEALMQ